MAANMGGEILENSTFTGAKAQPSSASTLSLIDTPVSGPVIRSRSGTTIMGARPSPTHSRARIPIPIRIATGTSSAWRAWELRGRARNEMPKALAKQARAKTPVKARMAAAIGSINLRNRAGS